MRSCAHCPQPISSDESWTRLERGTILGYDSPHPEVVDRRYELHDRCYVPFVEARWPRFVDTRVA